MNIDVDATYRDGVLYPQTPLNLPDNTPVRLVVAPQTGAAATEDAIIPGNKPPLVPKSQQFPSEQLRASLEQHSFAVAPYLPIFRAPTSIATTIDVLLARHRHPAADGGS